MPAKSKMFSALSAIALFGVLAVACEPAPPAVDPPLAGSLVVGGFDLVNSEGTRVTDDDFDGQYQMVYFGYAYCPNVCPFDTQRMVQGYEIFVEDNPEFADEIQPIFISFDPERDTPQVVGDFTAAFSDKLIGLTGSPENIEAALGNYYVQRDRVDAIDGGEGYDFQHQSIGYLVDRDGQPIALLPVEQSGEAVAAELSKWVR